MRPEEGGEKNVMLPLPNLAVLSPGCSPLPSPRRSADDVTTPGAHAFSCTPTRGVGSYRDIETHLSQLILTRTVGTE